MFTEKSRYARVPTATFTLPDGTMVRYARRRFLPLASSVPASAVVRTSPGQRLDQVANTLLRDPEAYWRLCDANNAMDPAGLVPPEGARLRVPGPEGGA